jgi:hypothetical protein
VVAVSRDAATTQTRMFRTIRAAVGAPSIHDWNTPMTSSTAASGRMAAHSFFNPAPVSRNRQQSPPSTASDTRQSTTMNEARPQPKTSKNFSASGARWMRECPGT